MSRRTALGWLLLVAALVSGWSLWRLRDRQQQTAVADSGVDYVLRDFELVALDKNNGHESLTLRAPEMQRNRADQVSRITTPLFLLPDQNGQHWTLRSQVGWLNPDGSELRLRERVEGDSPSAGQVPPTTFRSDALNVYPGQNQARTNTPVTMTRPGLVQTGTGFQVDLATRKYQLLSKVRTRYEPQAAKNTAH